MEEILRIRADLELAETLVSRHADKDAELASVRDVLRRLCDKAEAVYIDELISAEGERQRELAGMR